MNTIEKTVRTGNGFKERLHVKAFKHSGDMYAFLGKQPNNNWKVNQHDFKTGIYAFAGGKWHNVKQLDALTLAHI